MPTINGVFYWVRSNGDGTAEYVPDSPEVCARIDKGERGWFATPEGAILYGGVKACAFERTIEQTYDAAEWLRTGSLVPMGSLDKITITAEHKEG